MEGRCLAGCNILILPEDDSEFAERLAMLGGKIAQISFLAGRDGEPALCVYAYQDVHRMWKLLDMVEGGPEAKKTHYENLWQMTLYCENICDYR